MTPKKGLGALKKKDSVKRFEIPLKMLWLNSVFAATGPEKIPEVMYFRNFSPDFNKQKS